MQILVLIFFLRKMAKVKCYTFLIIDTYLSFGVVFNYINYISA